MLFGYFNVVFIVSLYFFDFYNRIVNLYCGDLKIVWMFLNGDEYCFWKFEESGVEFDFFIVKWKVRICVFCECVCILFYFCSFLMFILGVMWR